VAGTVEEEGARIRIDDHERRRRLVARHHLARTARDPVAAVRSVVAQHSSDPVTPYLAAWARVPDFVTHDLDSALYEARTLWRLHAMRRTLFVVATDEAPAVMAAATRDVARKERAKLEGWLTSDRDPAQVSRWLAALETDVLDTVADGQWRTQDLSAVIPDLATQVTLGAGKWATRAPLSSRLLSVMAMDGVLVRARPAGTWRSSQYLWAAARAWFAPAPTDDRVWDEAAARDELAGRYLWSHGPATATDLQWWTGWTKRQTAAVLERIGARPVDLDGGGQGFVAAGDVEPTAPDDGRGIALLPGLDSAPMGWKQRDWYLDRDDGACLFDTNGNVGPSVWVDGRVAGGWAQRPDGEVVFRLLADVGADRAAHVTAEAQALTRWLDGVVVSPRFRTPLERELAA
jgi:hypothetical protein